jgi:HEAT repeat protein
MRAELRGDIQDVIAPRAELRLKRRESNMSLWSKLRRRAMVAFTLLGMGLGFSVNSPLPTWGQVQEIPQTTSTSKDQDTSKERITELLGKLKDTNVRVRSPAARALVQIGKPAVPALLEALKDTYLRVRRSAAQALDEIRKQTE